MLIISLPVFLKVVQSINFRIFVYFQKLRGARQTLTSERTQAEVYYDIMSESDGYAANTRYKVKCVVANFCTAWYYF